jgi:HEAT repeat protein
MGAHRRILLLGLVFSAALAAQTRTDAEAFLAGLRGVHSADAEFVRASATALRALVPEDALAGVLAKHQADESPTVRLVVLEAEAQTIGLAAYAAALRAHDATRAEWALERLQAEERAGACCLLTIAADASAPFHAQAQAVLLRFDGRARRVLMADLLLRELSSNEWNVVAELMGLPRGSTSAELLPVLYADALLMSLAAECARSRFQTMLPVAGMQLSGEQTERVLAQPVPALVPYLRASWPEANARQRVHIARGLAILAHPDAALRFATVLGEGSFEERTLAFAAAQETAINPPEAAVLAAILSGDAALEAEALACALAATVALTPEALRPILPAVPEECAADVLSLLRRHGDAQAVLSLLQEAMGAESGFAAPALAAEALVECGQWSAEVEGALRHPDWRIRCLALHGCRDLPTEAALAAVESSVKDPVVAVRVAALATLGRIRNARARTLLVSFAQDESALAREQAALGLANQENWHIVPALKRLLDDEDVSVANAAAMTLFRHGFTDMRPRLEAALKWIWLERRTSEALRESQNSRAGRGG